MKKTFNQFNSNFIFGLIINCLLIGLGVFMFFRFVGNEESHSLIWTAFIPIAVSVYDIIYYLYYQVDFLDEVIFTKGNMLGLFRPVQYKTEIKYSEIEDIRLVLSTKNSKNESCRVKAPHYYFEFVLKNGKTKRLLIGQFTQKQRIEMLDIINSKTGKNFKYSQLEERDTTIYNYKNWRKKDK